MGYRRFRNPALFSFSQSPSAVTVTPLYRNDITRAVVALEMSGVADAGDAAEPTFGRPRTSSALFRQGSIAGTARSLFAAYSN